MPARHRRRGFRPCFDILDDLCLLSALTPAQLAQAYGLNAASSVTTNGSSVKLDGSGQTIAIVVAYHDPNLATDLHAFDQQFGLPDPSLRQVNVAGSATDDGWAGEESLDVEWAHAVAPGAKILVVEARSATLSDLLAAVNYARNQPGVSAVSMSWSSNAFSGESSKDHVFTTPSGHNGVTFLAASGDSGAFTGAQWPADSSNVVAVGGTSLYTDSAGNIQFEAGWNGSGGAISPYESEPSYQLSVQNSGERTTPDVSMVGDPQTGVYVRTTAPSNGQVSWLIAGGTSASTPMWAGLIALADEARALQGKGTLDGPTQTLPALYAAASAGAFNDVTWGYNGYFAGTGYDLVTGLGSPKGATVIQDLARYGSQSPTTASAAVSVVSGSPNVATHVRDVSLPTTGSGTALAVGSVFNNPAFGVVVPLAWVDASLEQLGTDGLGGSPHNRHTA